MRFFEAECQRLQGNWPSAMSTYKRLLHDFSFGVYREQTVAKMYEIARYWLENTLKQFDAEKEREEGNYPIVPWNFFLLEKSKPTFNVEQCALLMLEEVYYHDPTGAYAEKALFLVGYVNFQRGNFRVADQFLSALVVMEDRSGKPSPLKELAKELVIMAKFDISGSICFDDRKHAEAMKMLGRQSVLVRAVSAPVETPPTKPSEPATAPNKQEGREIAEVIVKGNTLYSDQEILSQISTLCGAKIPYQYDARGCVPFVPNRLVSPEEDRRRHINQGRWEGRGYLAR